MTALPVYVQLMGLLALWVLLPLIPAILIYWLFPDNKVAVTGPLAGLKVNASGAFAAYLIVFLVVIPKVTQTYNTIGTSVHGTWAISGKLQLIGKDGKDVHSANYFQKAAVRTVPSAVSIQDPIFFITLPDVRGGNPIFVVEIPDFGGAMKEVKAEEINWFDRTVEIKAPIVIREEPRNSSSDRPLTASGG